MIKNKENEKKFVIADGQGFGSRNGICGMPGWGLKEKFMNPKKTVHFPVSPTPNTVRTKYRNQQTNRHE